VDENKLTPLMLAVQKGHVEASRRLLAKEPACINMRAEDGASALMLGKSCFSFLLFFIIRFRIR
jgi:ankyrin repeat protein